MRIPTNDFGNKGLSSRTTRGVESESPLRGARERVSGARREGASSFHPAARVASIQHALSREQEVLSRLHRLSASADSMEERSSLDSRLRASQQRIRSLTTAMENTRSLLGLSDADSLADPAALVRDVARTLDGSAAATLRIDRNRVLDLLTPENS